jgi:hypothetical protein
LSASSQELLLGTAELELGAEEELPGSLEEDDTAELELSAEEELPGSLEDDIAELELGAEEDLPSSLEEDDTAELELGAEEELPGSLEDDTADELLISSPSQLGNSISGNSAQHKNSTAANARIIMKNFLMAASPH